MLEFREINIDDRDWINKLLKKSDFMGCEYSFANNMAWRRMNDSTISRLNDFYIVKSEDKNASLINLKLQKLLYYVQAWSYGIRNKPMFAGDFEAWIHGPVNRTIYDRFNPTKYLYSEINVEDCLNQNVTLTSDDAEFVDFILENYLKYSGAET